MEVIVEILTSLHTLALWPSLIAVPLGAVVIKFLWKGVKA